MKYLALTALLLASAFSHLASAQSDYHITWDIPATITISGNTYRELSLDINEGTKYLAANGLLSTGPTATPATGTCFFTIEETIFCSLTVDFVLFTIRVSPNLNGTIRFEEMNGNNRTATLILRSIE